jgi:hypothetical protein
LCTLPHGEASVPPVGARWASGEQEAWSQFLAAHLKSARETLRQNKGLDDGPNTTKKTG